MNHDSRKKTIETLLRKDKEILSKIGNTPMVQIGDVMAKAEFLNPSGSIKDRIIKYMVEKAEKRGELEPGQRILELTTGNTGIALSMISAIKGYKFTAVMPMSTGIERQEIMKLLGADLILTPAKDAMIGALAKYNEVLKQYPDAWLPNQFSNPDNVEENRMILAQEIIEQTKGKIDVFIAAAGTGGTVIGVGQALKKLNPKIKVVVIEPEESAVLSGKPPGHHRIHGIGEGFVPKILQDNLSILDEIVLINSNDAIKKAEELIKEHGLLVGISSGANVLGAERMAKKYKTKNVVTILCDRAERYFSEYFPR
jgi:cysteine synthase A